MLLNENCLDTMKRLPDNSIDAIITDPPYGILFMNKKWDYDVPSTEIWQEAYRILKPGAHMLVACGTRTFHRLVTRIEDVGFYPKDIVVWCHAQGFPKSMDVSKKIDETLGCEREVVGVKKHANCGFENNLYAQDPANRNNTKIFGYGNETLTTPSSDLAKIYSGWGTQLKPAMEMFSLLQKPISEKTIAKNVMKWGTGGINIDACRVALDGEKPPTGSAKRVYKSNQYTEAKIYGDNKETSPKGRFPSNLILDDSEEVVELFPITKSGGGNKHPAGSKIYGRNSYNESITCGDNHIYEASEGSASRFFYTAKASKSEKNLGLPEGVKNIHPTVKPVSLCKFLVNLIAPPGGIVYDPFTGSGSILVAAIQNRFKFLGSELDESYCEIANYRIKYALEQTEKT